jgi:hypothetical protein
MIKIRPSYDLKERRPQTLPKKFIKDYDRKVIESKSN